MLEGKRILLGVTGGIAAYKSAYLVRMLVREGAQVQVLLTPTAHNFVTPLTMATLSQRPVYTDFFEPAHGEWNSHVGFGSWGDLMVIAPASANTLAKMAHGVADNLLLATCLAARCPVVVAPTMDVDMYEHPATQANLRTLQERGVRIIAPTAGFLASGLQGAGRMAEPESIVAYLRDLLAPREALKGVPVLLTMGPTREAIDPVRFVSNRSSGRMGCAIVAALLAAGADVHCVAGPAEVMPTAHERLHLYAVESAGEMLAKCEALWPDMRVGVMAAAVADYRPAKPAEGKIKRTSESLTLQLEPSADIARTLGERKSKEQYLVGFALETEAGLEAAKEKMARKHLDLCVLNSLQDKGAGFGTPTNKTTLLYADGTQESRALEAKETLAEALVDRIVARVGG